MGAETIWYSRVGLWAGAAVLLIESIAGRGSPVLTVIAVLLLAAGLAGLCVGLWLESRMGGPSKP